MRTLTDSELDHVAGGGIFSLNATSAAAFGFASGGLSQASATPKQVDVGAIGAGQSFSFGAGNISFKPLSAGQTASLTFTF